MEGYKETPISPPLFCTLLDFQPESISASNVPKGVFNPSDYPIQELQYHCDEFEYLHSQDEIDFERLNQVLIRINQFSPAFSFRRYSTIIRQNCIIEGISRFLCVDNDEKDCNFEYLHMYLETIFNFTSKSTKLCEWCLKKSVISQMYKSFKFYDDISKSYVFDIFSNLYAKPTEFGQVLIVEKVVLLLCRFIHSSSDHISSAIKTLSTISMLCTLSCDEMKTIQIRELMLNTYFYIFDQMISDSYSMSLKGICGIIINDRNFISPKIFDISMNLLQISNNENVHYYSLHLLYLLVSFTEDQNLIDYFGNGIMGTEQSFLSVYNFLNSEFQCTQIITLMLFKEITQKIPFCISLLIRVNFSLNITEILENANFELKLSVSNLLCVCLINGTIEDVEYIYQNNLVKFLLEFLDCFSEGETSQMIFNSIVISAKKIPDVKFWLEGEDIQVLFEFMESVSVSEEIFNDVALVFG